jgi:hypothetical protein
MKAELYCNMNIQNCKKCAATEQVFGVHKWLLSAQITRLFGKSAVFLRYSRCAIRIAMYI